MFRTTAALLWSVLIFMGTCTANLERALRERRLVFHINRHPDWQVLLDTGMDWSDSLFRLQKAGHMTSFFGLAFILACGTKGWRPYGLALAYAVLTELLQLYFSRDGRLYDVGIDSVGILLAFLACRAIDRLRGPAAGEFQRHSR